MEQCVKDMSKEEIRHLLFDKQSDKNYSKDEKLERFKKLIAYKKTLPKTYKRGRVFITNGVEQKLILEDLPIPEGWQRGGKKRNEQQSKTNVED